MKDKIFRGIISGYRIKRKTAIDDLIKHGFILEIKDKEVYQDFIERVIRNFSQFKGNFQGEFIEWQKKLKVTSIKEVAKNYNKVLTTDMKYFKEPTQYINSSENFISVFSRSVTKLSPRHKQAFILKYFLKLSYEEAKEITGKSCGSLRKDVYDARKEILLCFLDMHAKEIEKDTQEVYLDIRNELSKGKRSINDFLKYLDCLPGKYYGQLIDCLRLYACQFLEINQEKLKNEQNNIEYFYNKKRIR